MDLDARDRPGEVHPRRDERLDEGGTRHAAVGAAAGRAQLRIGGDSTDWTWYPYGRHKRPAGVRYDITSRWLGVAGALAGALNAKTILGINLETNNPNLAAAEARAFIRALGIQRIEGLE